MNCTRRVFLTAASGLALGARMAGRPRSRRQQPGPHRRHRHGRPRARSDEPAQDDRRRGAHRGLRRLRAAAATGRGDRRAGSAQGGRLPPDPRQPRDRRRADRIARPLAQDDDARRDWQPARTSTSKSRSRTRSRKARRWCGRSRPRSRSCRPARSSGAGSTGCSASRSSTPASWARSRSSTPIGINTRVPGNYAPVADRETRLEGVARFGARPAVPSRALLSVAPFLGFRRRVPDRSDDALDRRRPLVHERRGAAHGVHRPATTTTSSSGRRPTPSRRRSSSRTSRAHISAPT